MATATCLASLRTITDELPRLTASIETLTRLEPTSYSPLSPSHVDDIQSLVSNMALVLSELGAISSTIHHIQTSIHESHRAHSRMATALARLPFEILAEIFELSQLSTQQSSQELSLGVSLYRPPRGHCGIVNVAQVCRDWRQVALATPRLWNRLDIITEAPLSSSVVHERLQLLERAKGCPLFSASNCGGDASGRRTRTVIMCFLREPCTAFRT
ncbi:hypothetical protein CONPUDRAFT_80785 [Coniophora puteana RWD-64-598 SS2]|uniref:F-box domain-containing protein n=1 Tax=Coniophora puteana (strain RWD-64-598) TaxID=741705 RepID=A0A5M3MZM5_CONPW|nr:uncharacterized protein CONPUDRAFT_80785 [Coniophora puteana RWD-64-598 SS2]EIW84447.1 hypothetical protein CONPUDRAFT_80785 [Coniophora puteana RWD-64-598 SS2]